MELYTMEPLAHEGLARLLQLDKSLQTPCIAFSDSFESSEDLTLGGSIKIGKSIALPPRPLGLDSSKAPYLQLSDEIAVLDNASSLNPEKLIEIASCFRSEGSYSRLIYAPAV